MRTFRAPGRVNLIGGQVDMHEGLVVSMAIDHAVEVVAAKRTDHRVVARAAQFDGVADIAADGSDDPAATEPAWAGMVAGVVRALAERGRRPVGCSLEVGSDIPVGAGLSSSAAFEVACGLALCDVAGLHLAPTDLARAMQHAEHLATGVPTGIQDQMAVLHGHAGHALFIDCRTLAVEPLAWPGEVAVLVVHSGLARTLAETPYAARIAESLAAAAQLGVPALRDATADQVRDLPRARHAVSEIARVQAFAAALRAGDLAALGPLMVASHASSRDDMGVSTSELDALVAALIDAGALGARLTGAGFGGCVVALAPAESATRVAADAGAAYLAATGREPQVWPVRPAAGAGRLG